MPVTVMLTPWLVYTAGEVTVRVIVLRESLQRSHQILLLIGWSSEGDVFLKRDDTKLVLGSNFSCVDEEKVLDSFVKNSFWPRINKWYSDILGHREGL